MQSVDRLTFFFTLVLFSLTSLVDGSRNPILFLSFSCGFLGLLSIWLFFCAHRPRNRNLLNRYRFIYAALILWLIYTFFQINQLFGLHSADPYRGMIKFYLYAGYVASLVLFTVLLHSPSRILTLASVIVGVALIQTFFGMANYYSDTAVFGWVPSHYAFSRVTGGYANRNLYASLVTMGIGFSLVWLMVSSSRTVPSARFSSPFIGNTTILASLIFMILFSGLLLSGSRAAIISFTATSIMVIILGSKDNRIRIRTLGLGLAVILAIVLAGIQLLRHRFAQIEFDVNDRIELWNTTIDIAANSVFTGFGAGAFESVFRGRNTGELGPMTYSHAHNDYLELLLEQGIIGLLLLGMVVIVAVVRSLSKLLRCRSLLRKRLILSGLFGISAICLHAMVDSPFQAPANVWVFIALVAMSLSAAEIEFETTSANNKHAE
jgi:putative inorganic carbon (HCO3(-)) transporter